MVCGRTCSKRNNISVGTRQNNNNIFIILSFRNILQEFSVEKVTKICSKVTFTIENGKTEAEMIPVHSLQPSALRSEMFSRKDATPGKS